MSSKSLILPIETKARELHGKLLLAIHTAEKGFDVTVGDQRILTNALHRFEPGIYLDKSVSRTKVAHYRRLRSLGFQIVAWCEEGLVYRDKSAYQFERISPEAMELIDMFFAWGGIHREDVLEVVPSAEEKVLAFGNPRFDLLQDPYRAILADEAKGLVQRHGPYILVVTTFSRFNKHESRDDMLGVLAARGFNLTPDQRAYYNELIEHTGQVFTAFAEMIPKLAEAFPENKVIVRPHPSENHDRWREIVAGINNVEVIYEGSVEPWILGSDAVIHNASTTGIGAYLLDHPVVSYMPIVDPVFNRLSHLPNLLSERPTTVDDVIAAVRRIQAGKRASLRKDDEKRQVASRAVANAFSPTSCEDIANALLELQERASDEKSERRSLSGNRLRFAIRNMAITTRRTLLRASPINAYMDQKFPGLTIGEIQSTLQRLSDARGEGAPPSARPHPRLPSCFLITAA